jgi:hypothetical protein
MKNARLAKILSQDVKNVTEETSEEGFPGIRSKEKSTVADPQTGFLGRGQRSP